MSGISFSGADQATVEMSLNTNIEFLKKTYSYPKNADFSFRELTIKKSDKQAALFYINTIVNTSEINTSIIEPLLRIDGSSIEATVFVKNIEKVEQMNDITEKLNNGSAVLFIDGSTTAYAFDVSDFKHRGIEKAENESLIKGPKEAFTESASINLSLIRKRIHNTNLIVERHPIGKRTRIDVHIAYVNDIANDQFIEKIKERLQHINVDSVRNLELLEQYIEDRPYSIVPTILYTERPDRAAAFLEDGYVILLMENSAACLILPVTFWGFFHSPEDHYLRFLYGNFSRLIRMAAFFITIFISAIYIAITSFHSEMIPPDLLFAIASARERVPFPVVLEVLIMEIAFELIREAGLRIPNPLGPTIGIVGALILGQAAVEANIISPIIVIIVALSGLSSFTISDISFNYALRLTKFLFIIGAALFGIYGLTAAFLLWLVYLASIDSFGVPFFAPMTPHFKSSNDTLFRKLLIREVYRPDFLDPKNLRKKKMR